jgi:hypothetical protein
MTYVLIIGRLLSDRTKQFAKSDSVKLGQQLKTLDFWMSRVRHCLAILDRAHTMIAFSNISSVDLKTAKKSLCRATFDFLKKCYVLGLMTKGVYLRQCAVVGYNIDPHVRYCGSWEGEVEDTNDGPLCLVCSPSGYACRDCKSPLGVERARIKTLCLQCSTEIEQPLYQFHSWTQKSIRK